MLKYNEPFSQRNYAQFHSFLLNFRVQKLNLNTAELSAGLYFVNVNVNGVSKTLRVNVAH